MSKIISVKAYEMLDSRGNPTVAAEIITSGGARGFALSPSGASTGIYEACELRDNDEKRYGGKGVLKAVANIERAIAPKLLGVDVLRQKEIDKIMCDLDGSENKSNLGANAILAVSLAAARAAADTLKVPLYRYLGGAVCDKIPRPMMNILNGGAHANNNIDMQEFMIVPVAVSSFAEGLKICCEIYHSLNRILKSEGLSSGVGDEGGFAPNLQSDEKALDFIMKAVESAGYSEKEINIALDVASGEWCRGRNDYVLTKRNVKMSADELTDYYEQLISKYPIISIEDGLGEDDWHGWGKLTKRMGEKIQLVGDDLFVTNVKRLEAGIKSGAANAILIKPNQIGTLTETLEVISLAKKNGYNCILSHRSGETEDTFIADLAVATGVGQIKTGAPCRSERVAKYNRLLMIEQELKSGGNISRNRG